MQIFLLQTHIIPKVGHKKVLIDWSQLKSLSLKRISMNQKIKEQYQLNSILLVDFVRSEERLLYGIISGHLLSELFLLVSRNYWFFIFKLIQRFIIINKITMDHTLSVKHSNMNLTRTDHSRCNPETALSFCSSNGDSSHESSRRFKKPMAKSIVSEFFSCEEEQLASQNATDLTSEELQNQLYDLREKLEQARVSEMKLLREKEKLRIDKISNETLIEELEKEKESIRKSLVSAYTKIQFLEKERVSNLTNLYEFKNKNEVGELKIENLEDQVEKLTKQLKLVIDEMNFEKQEVCDLQKQRAELTSFLQNYLKDVSSLKSIEENLEKCEEINQIANLRIRAFGTELNELNQKIENAQRIEEKFFEEQNKLFLEIEGLENGNALLKEELLAAEDSIKIKDEKYTVLERDKIVNEEKLKKIITEMRNKMEDLAFEVLVLNKRNTKLLSEKNDSLFANDPFSQKLGSNDFMKMLRKDNSEIFELKREIQAKNEQIQEMKNRNEENELALREQIESLKNMHLIRDVEERNREKHFKLELEMAKKQWKHMMHKNEELKGKETRMRLEIGDKDRIINHQICLTKRRSASEVKR